jgi:hypothetical protein
MKGQTTPLLASVTIKVNNACRAVFLACHSEQSEESLYCYARRGRIQRCFASLNMTITDSRTTYGFVAGRGFELFRISDSGVSFSGFPLKMMRFGFSASVSTSSLAYVVTTFRFRSVTWSCFNCS